jgi:hypothetical protein
MALDSLFELPHHRSKGIVLLKPMGKQMHPDKRHVGHDLDARCQSANRPMPLSLTRAPLWAIEPQANSPPVDLAKAHPDLYLAPCGLVEERPARARWLLLEEGPQQGLLNFTKFSASIKRWTCIRIAITLRGGKLHDFILLDRQFRMKSAHPS